MLARVGPVKLRLQVMSAETGAMGPGKAAVLEAIQTHGSITRAGRALGMSYKRCWALEQRLTAATREDPAYAALVDNLRESPLSPTASSPF